MFTFVFLLSRVCLAYNSPQKITSEAFASRLTFKQSVWTDYSPREKEREINRGEERARRRMEIAFVQDKV